VPHSIQDIFPSSQLQPKSTKPKGCEIRLTLGLSLLSLRVQDRKKVKKERKENI
jgi:hypothetical protein